MSHLPLIILHGALGSCKQFTELASSLSSAFDVHTLDFEGHGDRSSSSKDFSIDLFTENVREYMSNNNLVNAHFFGYSMGGYVALNLAYHSPGKTNKIITLATKFDWNPDTAKKETQMLNPDKIQEKVPAFADSLKERHGQGNWESVLQKTSSLMTELGLKYGLPDAFLKSIHNKTLITVGSWDKMVSMEESRHVAEVLPNGSFKTLEDFKHPIETADIGILTDEIVNFIEDTTHA